jgi:hypothetical protein
VATIKMVLLFSNFFSLGNMRHADNTYF